MKPRAVALIEALPVAIGAGFVAAFLWVALHRAGYAYELEWMEGAMVDSVRRVLHARPLYAEPTLEYTPFIYPPLYFYAAAGLSLVLGGGFLPLRLLSLVSSLGCVWLCHRFVERETGDRPAGWLAGSLFAATYALSGSWFDIGRVDSLFLLLLLLSFYGLRFARGARAQAGAGLLLCAAFFTKQVALAMAAPLLLYALLSGRRAERWYFAAAVLAGGVLLLGFEFATDGLYRHYVFSVPSRHALAWQDWSRMWLEDLAAPLPVACLLLAAALADLAALRTAADARPRRFYACMALGVLAGCFAARLHVGGYRNVVVPAYALAAIGSGLAAAALRRRTRAAPPRVQIGARITLAAALLVQLWLLRYDPRAHVPSAADEQAAQRLIARIRALPGDVLIPFHGHLAQLAGKRPHAHQMALNDLYRGDFPRWQKVDAELAAALDRAAFGAVVLDQPGFQRAALERRYRLAGPLLPSGVVPLPLTGLRTGPRLLYLPRPDARAGAKTVRGADAGRQ